MGLRFEGAVDNISKQQLDFIRDVLEKRGYKNTKVSIEVVGKAGDNYAASVKRIIVRDENGEFRMVAKIAPQHEFLRANMNTGGVFRNEHIMYTLILPKFQELEDQEDLPKKDRLRFAQCYGSLSVEPHEVILLEDMQVPGFMMLDRFTPLSDECIKSVLKNFALLHSLSFALKHKEPDVFNEYKSGLLNLWDTMLEKPQIRVFLKYQQDTCMMLVGGDHRKRIVKDSVLQGLALGAKLTEQNKGSKYTVIQQGDSWTNNILFRFDEDSLQGSVLIDYQLARENSPVCDLLYMIFNCTDHKARMEHFNDWIDYYHTELDKALANHGLKANYVYSRDRLDADMKRYAKVMFGISVVIGSNLILKPEDAVKLMEVVTRPVDENEISDSLQVDDETSEMIKARMEGLVDSFVKLGLL